MARDKYFNSGVGIALAASALMFSPRVRRAARSGIASAGSAATKVAVTVVRGTRNLREAEKHVTKFGVEAADKNVRKFEADVAEKATPVAASDSSGHERS